MKGNVDNQYIIQSEIYTNDHYTTIYKAFDQVSQKQVVIKAFKSQANKISQQLLHEYQIMMEVNDHPNIIQSISYKNQGILNKHQLFLSFTKDFAEIDYIVMESCKADLFQLITQIQKSQKQSYLKMPIIRSIFKQIIDAVKDIHQKNICHLDLKLENVFIDENGKIKLADFGCSQKVLNNGFLNSVQGTDLFMAPEIHEISQQKQINRDTYDGFKADIFSLGVILFCIIFRQQPFLKAKQKDNFYRELINQNYDEFWKNQKENLNQFSFEDQQNVKDIIQQLLKFNANERPSLEEIEHCNFMQGHAACQETCQSELLNILNNNEIRCNLAFKKNDYI